MMETIVINRDTCIGCGNCAMVCPAYILSMNGKQVELSNVDSCIVCGHCVAACPTDSVQHSSFPENKVHEIDYSAMPTAEQVMLLCKSRRSNRAFSDKLVPDAYLDMILEAAHCAPTASNMQQVEFTVVTNPEKLDFIKNYTIKIFSGVLKKLMNPILKPLIKMFKPALYKYVPSFKRLIREHANGTDLVLRNATAVVFIHTPKANRFGSADANLAYQNASLMAESLGVSQFYTGFVCSAISQDKSNALAKEFGITGRIHAGIALGMPKFRFKKYIDKKDIAANFGLNNQCKT